MLSKRFKNTLASSPLARLAAFPTRSADVIKHNSQEIHKSVSWLIKSKEHTNYTYDLTELNLSHLAWWVSLVTGADVDLSREWINEVMTDDELIKFVQSKTKSSARKGITDTSVRFGRRVGWYAIIRATTPQLVVETGTDKGLGSVLIASALRRNGHGRLITIDINPNSGFLIGHPYSQVIDISHGDSLATLATLNTPVDTFIHDSDHSSQHEAAELHAVQSNLTNSSIVISDNSHVSTELSDWAEANGRGFSYFQEEPANHWYRGAGIGAAYSLRI